MAPATNQSSKPSHPLPAQRGTFIEVGKRLLEELIEREMRASKASAQVNVAYWNEILIPRSSFLDDAIAYCEYDDFK
jgi:hypothetical protein